MTARWIVVLAVLAFLPGCSWWSGVTYPIPPTTDGASETPIAFEHYVQISWDSTDLSLLQSMDVQYPAQVSIVPSADTDELQVEIHFDVEKSNNDAYSQAYLQLIQAASNLNAQNAQVHVPAPQYPCQETRNAEGQITSLQGICVRELVISVPASHPIPFSVAAGGDFQASGVTLSSLQLVAADLARSDIEKLSGDVSVSGGGPGATLTVSQLGDPGHKNGNLTLTLNAIQTAQLSRIGGAVSIAITHPPTRPGAVTLDGSAITSFPYTRP